MRKTILLIITCVFFSGSYVFAKNDKTSASEKLDTATKDLVSCHVEFAKASIDRKCEKLKKKIREFEERLRYMEKYSDQIDKTELNNQRTELFNTIQKYEDQIHNLRLLKTSTEIIDFNSI